MDTFYRGNEDRKVPVNRILPFSAVDGPGNRTTIFLQGCNIDCKYCHNPETRSLCIGCGACVGICPGGALYMDSESEPKIQYNRAKCVECDACIQVCPHDASPKIEWLSASQVFERVKKQVPFISGITVSGGECTLYPEFIEELFGYCKGIGLTTLIDSNGMVVFENLSGLLAVTDGVMLDVKAYDEKDSIFVTGSRNANVIQNLTYLASIGKLEEIRTVVVEELFDAHTVVEKSGMLLKNIMDIEKLRYKLIAFRPYGVREQYQNYISPSSVYMEELKKVAQQVGFKEIIII